MQLILFEHDLKYLPNSVLVPKTELLIIYLLCMYFWGVDLTVPGAIQ